MSGRAPAAPATGASPHEVRRFLSHLLPQGGVIEIRVPKYGKYKLTASGYFDDLDAAVAAVSNWDGKGNVYVTLNPVEPSLLARAHNRILDRADNTTADPDITERRWLFIDVDPVRPSGISSTENELVAATRVGASVAEHLRNVGWPDPIEALSGNGRYLLYRLALPNDAEATDLVRGLLEALAERFDTADAHVDKSVFNPSRIAGVVGTLKMKGDSVADRPHRRSRLLHVPDVLVSVTREQLQSVASSPQRPNLTIVARNSDSLADILRAHGVEYREQPADANGVTWYHVRQCPFHDDGRPFECGVGQKLPDGPFAGHCFHPEGQGKTWHDWKLALGLSKPSGATRHRPDGRLPQIIVSRRHRKEIAYDAWRALTTANLPPKLFRHGRDIAEVASDGYDHNVIVHLSLAALSGHVDRCADFMRETQNTLVPARPPRDVIEDMDAMSKPLPLLRGIIGTPVFDKDGALVTDVGYQSETGLFYQPAGEPVAPVPGQPDETHLRMAKQIILLDWLGDFPFIDDASRANAIAMVITALAREMIPGPTPLFAIDAPSPGTGKGLLVGGATVVITGREPAVTTPPRDETEFRKFLTTKLNEGAPILLLDNIKRRVDSGALAAALTADIWTDRILGGSKSADVPVRNVWVCTGNNLQLADEISRRSIWIRLDAKRDRPWEGRTYRHPDLKAWVHVHRHDLVWAFLVLVQHWVASGRQAWDGKVLGSYEDWSRVVGGVLQKAGIAGFMENREELYERSDSVTEEWRRFTRAWWECHGARVIAVSDVLESAQELLPTLFAKVRDGASDRALRTKLGKALAEQRDRRFGDLFLLSAGIDSHTKAALWRLEPAEVAEPDQVLERGSAEVPQENDAFSDSFAEVAELAEDDPGSPASIQLMPGESTFAGEGTDRHPQLPQVPQSDSDQPFLGAEPLRDMGTNVPDVPQCKRCTRVPEKRSANLCDACREQALSELMKGQQ